MKLTPEEELVRLGTAFIAPSQGALVLATEPESKITGNLLGDFLLDFKDVDEPAMESVPPTTGPRWRPLPIQPAPAKSRLVEKRGR